MNTDEFSKKLKALSGFIIPFANTASFKEHSLSNSERMVLDLVTEARVAKLNEKTILSGLANILQKFIVTSEVMKFPLSNETESLIKKAKKTGMQ